MANYVSLHTKFFRGICTSLYFVEKGNRRETKQISKQVEAPTMRHGKNDVLNTSCIDYIV